MLGDYMRLIIIALEGLLTFSDNAMLVMRMYGNVGFGSGNTSTSDTISKH